MGEVRFSAYHGTDKAYLNSIISNGFEYKPNKEHWLGNGIYFFIEYDLAKWWTMIKHPGFGNSIDIPVIIKVELRCDIDYIVDLRLLEDYNWIYERYDDFHSCLLKNGSLELSINQLRCAFFDWLKEEYGIKIIVAGFQKKSSSYLKGNLLSTLKIPYVEYQVCVYDESVITIISPTKEGR